MSPERTFRTAVVGATGAVGQELLKTLEARGFPVSELSAFASPRSVGQTVKMGKHTATVRALSPSCFAGIDFAFFDASDAVSTEWVPEAARAGAWVIDNSAAFRMESDIPLVVPEINGALVAERLRKGVQDWRQRVFSGPNCSTVQLALSLQPLHRLFTIRRVVVSTYQSTSGAGAAAMQELRDQTQGALAGVKANPKAFSHKIAFNCIPQIGGFRPDGYTSEEEKIIQETRKILGIPNLRINATAVRVPTLSGHGESVNVEFEKPSSVAEARQAWSAYPGILVQDEPMKKIYPMGHCLDESGVQSAAGRDFVGVGRIRKDESVDSGLCFWIVSDNLRKGAALNAVQIGEQVVRSIH